MKNPVVIAESWSYVCNIQAFVEKSDTCYYFYLWINPESDHPKIKSCWICNRVKAPSRVNTKIMKKGIAPIMPAAYISHDKRGMELDEKKLSIVWFEEGDSAALLYEDNPICVIPGWSGYNGFHGYSKYAAGIGPFAWEMTGAMETLTKRIQKSKAFWNYFDTNFWGDIQQMHMCVLEQFFGKHERYYAIDGGKFPPKALISGCKQDIIYGITAGVSLIPMPTVEQYFEDDAENFRRIELGIAVTKSHRQLAESMYSALSGLASIPWKEITFFAHGHTVPFHNINGFSALLFINPKFVPELEQPSYNQCMNEDINLLWLVPITQEEYDFVRTHDVHELLQKAIDIFRLHIFDGQKKFIL